MKYIFFDLDNTICESRQNTTPAMYGALHNLQKNPNYKIFIIGGLDYKTASSQCDLENILYMSQNGNEQVFSDPKLEFGKQILLNIITQEEKENIFNHVTLLVNYLEITDMFDKVEDRGAQISISFVGHHAQINDKRKFDPDRTKRIELLKKFPFSNAFVAGTTCIDYILHTKGDNISKYIKENNIKAVDCLYIGDALEPGANDYSVVGIIPTHSVKNPTETLEFIKQL